jgi:agmatinase
MVRVALIGAPYDARSSFLRGAAGAPSAIRVAMWSPAGNSTSEDGVELDAVIDDAGDLQLEEATEAAFPMIEAEVARWIDRGNAPLLLGGDHSISFPALKAVARRWPDLEIVHFDAHPDLYAELDGDPFSHACPFARVMEAGLAKALTQVGIRTMNAHQRAQADRFGARVIEAREVGERLHLASPRPVYVSIDLDVLDPAFAPGVSHWEPGGLSTRQVLAAIQGLGARVIGGDVVEYNPARDPSGMTAHVAAKLARELAAKMVRSSRG